MLSFQTLFEKQKHTPTLSCCFCADFVNSVFWFCSCSRIYSHFFKKFCWFLYMCHSRKFQKKIFCSCLLVWKFCQLDSEFLKMKTFSKSIFFVSENCFEESFWYLYMCHSRKLLLTECPSAVLGLKKICSFLLLKFYATTLDSNLFFLLLKLGSLNQGARYGGRRLWMSWPDLQPGPRTAIFMSFYLF